MCCKSKVFFVILFSLSVSLSAQVPVILDADLDSDVDDVGAMAMLHTLADHHRIKILGVIVTSDDENAAGCASAINTFFKRPEIPIGVEKGISLRAFSKYTKEIASRFPHPLKEDRKAEDATSLYRKLLANSPDQSVVLISIGHLTNIRNLLKSKPDEISPLDGLSLIKKKVKLWSCMGGQYPQGKEANFYRPDPSSTLTAINNWPGEIIFSGWEIGKEILTGGEYLKNSLGADHPVSLAYRLYNGFAGRQSWDQTSVLFAVSPNNYWQLSPKGKVLLREDGSNSWKEDPKGLHRYLIVDTPPTEIAKIIDSLMIGVYRPGF